MASTSIISLRVTEDEKRMLLAAARSTKSTVSEFVRRQALQASEVELMSTDNLILTDNDWQKLEDALAHDEAPNSTRNFDAKGYSCRH